MNSFVVLCVIAVASAELPRFRNARFRSQRQEVASSTTDATTTEGSGDGYPPASGPYPPSGWKPSEPFILPNEQLANQESTTPSATYGPPTTEQSSGPYPPSGWTPSGEAFNLPTEQKTAKQEVPSTSYGLPDNTYGPPDTEYGAPSTESDTTVVEAATDNPQAEELVDVQRSEGTYFILLPNGQLQKVDFTTAEDPKLMAYTAQLRYPATNQAPLFVFRPSL